VVSGSAQGKSAEEKALEEEFPWLAILEHDERFQRFRQKPNVFD
jgi:hypothetical protein